MWQEALRVSSLIRNWTPDVDGEIRERLGAFGATHQDVLYGDVLARLNEAWELMQAAVQSANDEIAGRFDPRIIPLFRTIDDVNRREYAGIPTARGIYARSLTILNDIDDTARSALRGQ